MRGRYLIFKSGLKGIFKYKIQFFIIIVLSFFATFFLISMQTFVGRLNKTYQDVVATAETYEYEYERKFNKSSVIAEDISFIPLLDFVNDNYSTIDAGTISTRVNFDLATFSGEENFITSALSSNKFKKEVFREKLFTDSGSGQGHWGSYYNFDGNSGLKTFYLSEVAFHFGEKYSGFVTRDGGIRPEEATIVEEYLKSFINVLINEFKTFYISDNKTLTNTLIYKSMKNYGVNEGNFDKIFRLDRQESEANEFSDELKALNAYLYNAFETIAWYVYYQTVNLQLDARSDFESEYLSGQENDPSIMKPENYIKAFNEKFWNVDEGNNDRPKLLIQKDDNEYIDIDMEWEDQNAATAYEYIFGKEFNYDGFNDKVKHNTQYIVDENSKAYTKDIVIDNVAEDSFYAKDIYKTGLRGQTNPIIVQTRGQEANDVYGIKDTISTKMFEKLSTGEKFLSKANGIAGNFDDWKIANSNMFSMEWFHQKMAADYTNIDLKLRQEAFMYDVATKKSFRFVILDDKDNADYNFSLVAGLKPMTASELVISQQFASKNNIKIGQKLNIGKSQFVISGFGADSLSYYPITDLSLPTTDIQNSAIVYINKETINIISANGNADDINYSNYYFINDKKENNRNNIDSKIDALNLEQKVALFDGWLFNSPRNLNEYSEIINYTDPSTLNLENQTINNIVKFSDTNFSLNWTLQPVIISALNIFVYITSGLVTIMVIVALVFAIKKSVENNSKQIGYMKSLGYRPNEVALLYIGYGLLIALAVVPAAFIISGFFQELLSIMFSSYFATTLYEFIFNPLMFGVAFGILGVTSIVVSYIIAYAFARKNTLKLLNSVDNTKIKKYNNKNPMHKLLDKFNFNFRFAYKITTRGKKQVWMISIAIFVSTLIVSLSTAVPAVMNNYIKDANKNLNYKNSYSLNAPIANMPITKSGLSATSGILKTEEVYKELPEGVKDTQLTYYDDYRYYNDGNNNTSTFAPLIYSSKDDNNAEYDENKLRWLEEYVYQKSPTSETYDDEINSDSGFLGFFVDSIVNSLFNLNGSNISLGSIEKFMGYLMHSNINPETGEKFTSLISRLDSIGQTNAVFKELIPKVLGLIGGNIDIENIPKDDWKEAVIQLIFAFVPNSGQKYIKDSENRKSQFTFGINYETYTPTQETLTTDIKFAFNGNNEINIIGLNENQKAFNIDQSNLNQTLLDNEVIKQIEDVISGKKSDAVVDNGFVIYDPSNKVLNIPVASNLQSDKTFNLEDQNLNNVYNQASKLVYKAKTDSSYALENNVVPVNAWIYDNRDWSSVNNNTKPEWINAGDIDVNKINYSLAINEKGLIDGAPMFSQVKENEEENLELEVRPYYSYNNLKLFFPKNKVDMSTYTTALPKLSSDRKNQQPSDWKNNLTTWYGEVSNADVPTSVKEAWGEGGDYFYISPYALSYHESYSVDKKGTADIKTIGDSVVPWMEYAFGDENRPLHIQSVESKPNNIDQINIVKRNTIDSYNSDLVVADQDLINLIYGYSNSRYIPVSYNALGKLVDTQEGVSIYDNVKVQDYIPDSNDSEAIKNILFESSELQSKGLDPLFELKQNSWFNTKYSNFEELTGITTGIKFGNTNKPSVNYINKLFAKENKDSLKLSYGGIELASSKLGIVVTVAETILGFSVFIITGIIIISTLIITVITDVFVMKYQRFMVTMKAMGYSKWYIFKSSMGITIFISLISIMLGILAGMLITKVGLSYVSDLGVVIPFVLESWVIPVTILIIAITLIVSIYVSLKKPLKEKPTVLLSQ